MGREVRRVPLDFEAPLDEVWAPLLDYPERFRFPKCPDCENGYSPMATFFYETAWKHKLSDPEKQWWLDKLTQEDVDWLIEQGELRVHVSREPTEDDPRTWERVPKAWTVEQVNAAQKAGTRMFDPLDLQNTSMIHVLIRRRCEQLGVPTTCPTCDGHADVATPAQREEAEAWEPLPIPEGPGWQLWSTTTEGSPMTPVFRSAEDLAAYCAGEGVSWFGYDTAPYEDWLMSFIGGTTEVDTMLKVSMPPPPTREQAGIPPEDG